MRQSASRELAQLDAGQIRELDLDTEQGTVVWEILTRDGGLTEFAVDATTGDIVKQEQDD